ncbi:immunoglobulin alpha Fc receptor isoform X1 [Sapajus apella]|uniref:immunoglobulin alpha Fc receptor isoform X1 n=1 Tax=Sapajus apella TaxID=9515 RepID=UPI00137B437C|nr:immunoglobulin alpha Fc receptor isoform X1 [Sapajus apella]
MHFGLSRKFSEKLARPQLCHRDHCFSVGSRSEVEGNCEHSYEKSQRESHVVMRVGLIHHFLCISLARWARSPPTASRIRAMPSALPALLCLGLCLSQRISTQQQTLPKPSIWAKPSFMVPKEKPATICCQGNYGAIEYQLHFEGRLSAVERPKPPERINKVKFHIPAMTSRTAGRYSCFYRVGELWSEPSDSLDLVVTGMYDTPTLSVHPGPEVILGEKVTFYCHLGTATSTFFLLKEGRSSVRRGYGKVQAEFPMGSVTTSHRGTYRCFGSYNNHAWSFPSEPVKLLITGDTENTSLAPTDPTSPDSGDTYLLTTDMGLQKELALWDHTAQNLLRAGLAFLVLVALVWLLVEDWLSRKRTREPASRASTRHCRRSLNTKTL